VPRPLKDLFVQWHMPTVPWSDMPYLARLSLAALRPSIWTMPSGSATSPEQLKAPARRGRFNLTYGPPAGSRAGVGGPGSGIKFNNPTAGAPP